MTDVVRIRELFEVEYGNQLDKNKMIEDPEGINFVSRSASDLGVDGRVETIHGIEPYASGLITVPLGGHCCLLLCNQKCSIQLKTSRC